MKGSSHLWSLSGKEMPNRVLTKEECDAVNKQFFIELDKWNKDGNKKSWDYMFSVLNNICLSLAKQKCAGVINEHLEERALDAAIEGMGLIKRGKGPERALIAWNNMHVVKHLYRHKNEDREQSYEGWAERNHIVSSDE